MSFIKMPGVTGNVFVPEEKERAEKKHNCKDCFSCQMCSDDRCRLCRKSDSEKAVRIQEKMPDSEKRLP